MAFAQGARSSLAYITETAFGQTPATPTLAYLPIKTHSLDLTKERLEGQDIQPDEMPRVDRHGNRSAGGSIEIDLRKGDYDEFLESVMRNTFSTDTLKVGTTPKFFTIEDAAEDVGEFRLFTGMTVSQATFNIAPNQMVETTFEMVGQNGVQQQTTASSGGAKTPISNNPPFDSYNGEILEGGATESDAIGIVGSIEFSINRSYAPTFVVGSDFAPQLENGRAVVSGTMSVYYKDSALIDKFLNEEETEITVTVDDPSKGNAYTFFFPRVKYNGGSVPLANPQSRMVEIPFVSLYDETEESNLVITRTS